MDNVGDIPQGASFESLQGTFAQNLKNFLIKASKNDVFGAEESEQKDEFRASFGVFFKEHLLLKEIEKDKKLLSGLNLFKYLSGCDGVKITEDEEYVRRVLFSHWVETSTSDYALAYRRGKADAASEIMTNSAKRATNGRRLIGANSREKVKREALKLMHLRKEQAAIAMASAVNLEPGTIRRYLSELFPGDSWPK